MALVTRLHAVELVPYSSMHLGGIKSAGAGRASLEMGTGRSVGGQARGPDYEVVAHRPLVDAHVFSGKDGGAGSPPSYSEDLAVAPVVLGPRAVALKAASPAPFPPSPLGRSLLRAGPGHGRSARSTCSTVAPRAPTGPLASSRSPSAPPGRSPRRRPVGSRVVQRPDGSSSSPWRPRAYRSRRCSSWRAGVRRTGGLEDLPYPVAPEFSHDGCDHGGLGLAASKFQDAASSAVATLLNLRLTLFICAVGTRLDLETEARVYLE